MEIYSYDFMIDDQYNVWLIEVNSSPTMEFSSVNLLIINYIINNLLACYYKTLQISHER